LRRLSAKIVLQVARRLPTLVLQNAPFCCRAGLVLALTINCAALFVVMGRELLQMRSSSQV
jgi:hypothetical protein